MKVHAVHFFACTPLVLVETLKRTPANIVLIADIRTNSSCANLRALTSRNAAVIDSTLWTMSTLGKLTFCFVALANRSFAAAAKIAVIDSTNRAGTTLSARRTGKTSTFEDCATLDFLCTPLLVNTLADGSFAAAAEIAVIDGTDRAVTTMLTRRTGKTSTFQECTTFYFLCAAFGFTTLADLRISAAGNLAIINRALRPVSTRHARRTIELTRIDFALFVRFAERKISALWISAVGSTWLASKAAAAVS
ncbi:hypothetical protein ACLMJK_003734 [Lecanora helva]